MLAALLFMAAAAPAATGDALTAPVVADLVAGAEACATRKLSDAKMGERLAELGWVRKESVPGPGTKGTISIFDRNSVRLMYFTSKELTECEASLDIDVQSSIDPLLPALSEKFGKQPKAETPGVRYLYFLPRLNILTVQVKPRDGGRTISLSVVH